MKLRVNDYEESELFSENIGERYSLFRIRGYDTLPINRIHDSCKVILAESGAALYRIGGKRYQVEAGDILVVGAMEVHENQVIQSPYQCYGLLIHPVYLKSILTEDLQKVFETPEPECFCGKMKAVHSSVFLRLTELLIRLHKETQSHGTYRSQMQRVLITELAVLLFRIMERERTYGEITAANARMRDVRAYIDIHFREDIGLASLSSSFYLHPSTISKEFKRYCGYNINRYINVVRICEAVRLLQETSISVEEVGKKSGFDSENTFLRQFRAIMSISPLQYRKIAAIWSGKLSNLEITEPEEAV